MILRVEAADFPGFGALATAWRALEAEGDTAFFQSWSWVGCLAEERFPEPVLLRALRADGGVAGLALFNRRKGRLHLGSSGDAALDSPYVEHNAPLGSADAARALLAAAWQQPGIRRLVLPGMPAWLATAAGGTALRLHPEAAPRVDLDAVRAAGGDYLATLSANARQQLRRSARHYAARGLVLEAATEVGEAHDWLDALIALHTTQWQRRGKPGAFAEPFMRRFHRALIARALPRGEIELLRGMSGGRPIGYLYNFRFQGGISAYQSGLDMDEAGNQAKPGLTLHQLAIERALAQGARSYDFLAGPTRYKTSLANAETRLAWAELVRPWSALGAAARISAWLRRQARRSPAARG